MSITVKKGPALPSNDALGMHGAGRADPDHMRGSHPLSGTFAGYWLGSPRHLWAPGNKLLGSHRRNPCLDCTANPQPDLRQSGPEAPRLGCPQAGNDFKHVPLESIPLEVLPCMICWLFGIALLISAHALAPAAAARGCRGNWMARA